MKQTGLLVFPDGLFPVLGGSRLRRDDDVDRGLLPWFDVRFLAPSLEVLRELGLPGVFDRSREGRPDRGPR